MTTRRFKDDELRRVEAEAQSAEALATDEARLRPKLDAATRRHDEILRRSREVANCKVLR